MRSSPAPTSIGSVDGAVLRDVPENAPTWTTGRSAARATELAQYILVGLLLGVVLVKSEIVSWYRIQEMFRFQAFHMYGILGSAMLTAFVSVQLLQRLNARALNGERIAIPPKLLGTGRRYGIGGLIFGIGWAFTGACPGPLFVLVGSGSTVFVAVGVAALLGTWSYGYLRPRLPHWRCVPQLTRRRSVAFTRSAMNHHHTLMLGVALLVGSTRASSLHAQTDPSPTLSLIGGVSSTTLVGKDAADNLDRRLGVIAGLSVVYTLTSMVQIEMDALYARKGFRSTGATSTFDFSSAYLEIPVLLRLEFAPHRRVRPFIVAGPAFGAQIDCGGTTTSSSGTLDLNCTELVARSGIVVKKTDVSAVLGGGIGLPFGAAHLTLATRYTMGFLSVIGNNDNHNRALSFYVGLSRARRD